MTLSKQPIVITSRLYRRPYRFGLVLLAAGLLAVVLLAGCASTPPPTIVAGNGSCHPSVDLPAHKTMKKVPVSDTFMEDLFGLLLSERHEHYADIQDYNSLYETCVGKPAK